jgi:hypothetical protein
MTEIDLDTTPVKLQSWTPKWRRDRAVRVAEKYGTTVTDMINEGLDFVTEKLENQLKQAVENNRPDSSEN